MKLNKRYVHSIKANLPFYIAASVLTMVTLLMFYLFYIAGTGINAYGDEFFSKNKLESATFSTYMEIPDEELSALESKYGVTLEKERFAGDVYREGALDAAVASQKAATIQGKAKKVLKNLFRK